VDDEAHANDPKLNRLIAHLPEAEWAQLEPHATVVQLAHAQQVFTGGERSDVSYFPLTSIISMISEMANGDESEYGCIGREGMLGLHVVLGAQPLRGQALCQLKGNALCLDGSALRSVTLSGKAPELHRLLLRYAQATINTLAQASSCNALHNIHQRTARWLLLSRDRAGSDTFSLTHEFLSRMLGVRRASVPDVA
jgi:CRP-like cAMP-binding protein